MSASVVPKSQDLRELPSATPLDETMWRAWALKGLAQEQRSHAVRMKALKWILLAILLSAAAAGFEPYLTPYHIAVRFIVAAGATALMFEALRSRYYAFGFLFGALALLYNPVSPLFSLSGEWQRALVLASALPLVASLTWREVKLVPNEQN